MAAYTQQDTVDFTYKELSYSNFLKKYTCIKEQIKMVMQKLTVTTADENR